MKIKQIVVCGLIAVFALAFTALSLTGCEQPDDPEPEHVHQWGKWSVTSAATCTEAGSQTRYCALDSSHVETQVIDALGHDYQNWAVISAATCEDDGEEEGTCTHDTSHTDTRAIPALGHDYQNWVVISAATCEDDGEEEGTCAHNSLHKDTRAILALGHDYEWEPTTTSSFIEEFEEIETCSHDPSHTGGTRTADPLPITNAQDWSDALAELSGKNGSYTLTIGGSFSVDGSTSSTFNATASGETLIVTLKGSGTVSLSANGNLIRVGARQTLNIDSSSLTLQGKSSNNNSVVYLNDATAKFNLINGTITGNTFTGFGSDSGAVNVYNGTFNMSGGEISGNTGGGVYVNGTFTMGGGKIANNAVTSSGGGGVYVSRYGTFNMEGGEISNNNASVGGGVNVAGMAPDFGIFNMSGGKISNNTASSQGGGVFVDRTTFTMTGGEISENKANIGGGIYVNIGGSLRIATGIMQNNTATNYSPGLFLNTGVTAERGTFSGPDGAWVRSGDISSGTSIILLVNGEGTCL